MKTCNYEGCTNPVWGGGFCKFHQGHRPKQSKIKSDRGLYKRENNTSTGMELFESDREFYSKIWGERSHKCFNCEAHLPSEALTLYFHHVLEKRNYPQFRHEDWNIVILCPDCHTGYETYPNPKKFEKIIDLKNKLLEEKGN